MQQLSLKLIGSFEARASVGQSEPAAVSLPTDKTRALLVYLALGPQGALRREALAALLWPEQEEGRARQNLRKTIARLRKALDEAAPGLADNVLTATRQAMMLAREQCSSDVQQSRAELATVTGHGHDTLWQCESCMARLEETVSTLQGGELLEGFSLPDAAPFEGWLREEREALHRERLQALQWLAEAYEEAGAGERAAQAARQMLGLEPWREDAHRRLMRLAATQGERAAALAQYQACRDVLREELGLEPEAETEALLARIMDGSMASRRAARPAAPRPLPPLAQPLVGRRAEIQAVMEMLDDAACRLVTLVGPGGMGKTSLALAVARRWQEQGRGAVAFVGLVDVTKGEQLPAALADGLNLALHSRRSIEEQVAGYLRQEKLLLVLDNVEAVHAEDGWLQALSRESAQLTMLATARGALNWSGEWRFGLQGLRCPQADGDGGMPEAVALFMQAAQRVQPGFRVGARNEAAVGRICRLVQGWPLALQMAAGWLRAMPVEEIAAQIEMSLDFLTSTMRDVPARQQSVRTVFEHTWKGLQEEEQAVLAQLAVFRGAFSHRAAQTVAGATPFHLLGLVDKSLLEVEEGGERYRLHPLLRQFAAEKGAQQQEVQRACEGRHAAYYLGAMREIDGRLGSDDYASALETIRKGLENVRQAWLYAAGGGEEALLLDSVAPLATYYEHAGLPHEAAAFLRDALTQMGTGRVGAHMAYHLAHALSVMGHYGAAEDAARQAQALAQESGDVTLANRALIRLAEIEREEGYLEQALATLQQAIGYSQAQKEAEGVARALRVQGNTYWSLGQYERARACYEQARTIHRGLGQGTLADVLTGNIGAVYWKQGRPGEALPLYEVALAARRRVGDTTGEALWLGNIGLLYADMGEDARALQVLDEALAMHSQLGRQFYKIELLLGKTALYLRRGELKKAVDCQRQALDIAQDIGNRTYLLDCDLWQARLLAAQGRREEATQLLRLLLVREFRPNVKEQIFEALSAGPAPQEGGREPGERSAAAGPMA